MQNKQFFSLAVIILTLAGCGGQKQTARSKSPENRVDMTVAQAEGDAASFFDQDISGFQDIDTFVLDEENAGAVALNQPATQLAWQEPANSPDNQMEVLYFEYDRPDLRKDQQSNLARVKNRVSEWLKRGDTVVFKGNCCRWGKNCNTRNFPLSNDRAYAAVDLIADRNNPQIKVFGVGSEEPVVFDETTKEAQAPNRRVEIYPLSV